MRRMTGGPADHAPPGVRIPQIGLAKEAALDGRRRAFSKVMPAGMLSRGVSCRRTRGRWDQPCAGASINHIRRLHNQWPRADTN
jgi:hypothetical protein